MTLPKIRIPRSAIGRSRVVPCFLLLFLVSNVCLAELVLLKSRIVNVVSGNLYIDVGRGKGIKLGDVGRVMKHGVEIDQAEVVELDVHSATVRLLATRPELAPSIGDQVVFQLQYQKTDEDSSPFRKPPKKNLEESNKKTEFVPLQSPITQEKNGVP